MGWNTFEIKCPAWFVALNESHQNFIKLICEGEMGKSPELIQKLEDEVGICTRDAQDFLNWWFHPEEQEEKIVSSQNCF